MHLIKIFNVNENFKDIQLNANFLFINGIELENKDIIDLEDLFDFIHAEKINFNTYLYNINCDDIKSDNARWIWKFDKIIFYDMLIELLDLLEWDEFDISIYTPENYNFTIDDFKDDSIVMPKIVMDKNILHYDNQCNKIYKFFCLLDLNLITI